MKFGILFLCALTVNLLFSCEKDKVSDFFQVETDIDSTFNFKDTAKVMVVIFGGQSNATSGNSANLLPGNLKEILKDVYIWNQLTQQFENYSPGVNGQTLACTNKASTSFGPELLMGIKLNETLGKRIFIIKHTYGGAPFYNYENYDFNPTSDHEGFYDFHLQVKNALKSLTDLQINYKISAMTWVHGEQDGKNEAGANNYKAKLATFVQSFRDSTNFDFKFVYTRLASQRAYLDVVRAQQEAYELEYPNSKMINIDDLPFNGSDNTHYYWNEINVIGERLAECIDF